MVVPIMQTTHPIQQIDQIDDFRVIGICEEELLSAYKQSIKTSLK